MSKRFRIRQKKRKSVLQYFYINICYIIYEITNKFVTFQRFKFVWTYCSHVDVRIALEANFTVIFLSNMSYILRWLSRVKRRLLNSRLNVVSEGREDWKVTSRFGESCNDCLNFSLSFHRLNLTLIREGYSWNSFRIFVHKTTSYEFILSPLNPI